MERLIKKITTNLAYYKIVVSVVFGGFAFYINLHPLHLPQFTQFKATILISLFFPLIIAKAWGMRYGLLCALAGGCQSMWWTWQSDGYGILYAVPVFTIWIAFHGFITDLQKKQPPNKWYLNQYTGEIFFRFFSALGFYTIFPILISYNPPFWNNTITTNTVSIGFINTVVIKHIIVAYILLLICNVLLKITFFRRFFLLGKDESEKDASHIVSISVLIGISLWFFSSFIHYITSDTNKSFLDNLIFKPEPCALINQTVILICSFIVGLLVAHLWIQKNTTQKTIELERKKLFTIFENLPGFVCLIDSDYKIKFANKTFHNIIGEKHPENKRCYSVFYGLDKPCKDCPGFQNSIHEQLKTKQWQAENLRQYLVHNYFLKDIDGHSIILKLGIDITEQNIIQKALTASKQKYQAYIENAPHGVLVFDSQKNYIEANKTAEIITGYSKNEIISMKLGDLTTQEDKYKIPENLNELLSNQRIYCTELSLATKDRSEKYTSYTITKISENKFLAFCEDITQRKKAERTLAENEERYRLIADKINILIYDIDCKTDKVKWSGNIQAVTGYTPQEFENIDVKSFEEMIHPDERQEMITAMGQAIKNCSPNIELRFNFKYKNNEYKYMYSNATVITDDSGKPLRVLGIMRDISAQKQAQDKLIKYQNQLKSLALKVSAAEEQQRRRIAIELHDTVGQTLVICGIKLQIMKKLLTSEETKKAADEIIQLTRDVIEQTKSLTFDMSSPILYEIGLNEAIQEYLESHLRKDHGIDYEFINHELQQPLEKNIQILLFRDIKEMLTNVIKHSQATKVTVTLKENNNMFEVEIQDNGIGFDTSSIKPEVTRSGGFGLFSTKERISGIAGQFNIESQLGSGTKVTLTVPIKEMV